MKLKFAFLLLSIACAWALVPTSEVDAQCFCALDRCCIPAYAAPPPGMDSCSPKCVLTPSCSGTATATAVAGQCKSQVGATCCFCPGSSATLALCVYNCTTEQCDHPCYSRCRYEIAPLCLCCVTVNDCTSSSIKCQTFP